MYWIGILLLFGLYLVFLYIKRHLFINKEVMIPVHLSCLFTFPVILQQFWLLLAIDQLLLSKKLHLFCLNSSTRVSEPIIGVAARRSLWPPFASNRSSEQDLEDDLNLNLDDECELIEDSSFCVTMIDLSKWIWILHLSTISNQSEKPQKKSCGIYWIDRFLL